MSKRTRGKKANATRPKRGRATKRDRDFARLAPVSAAEPDVFGDVAETLGADGPVPLLMLVSSLIASLDVPRTPFDPEPDEEEVPTVDELVDGFLAIDRPETSALLAVIAEFIDDELLRHRAGRELRSRSHPLPGWLSALGRATATDVLDVVDVLGDAENVAVGVRVPSGAEFSVVVYVDHNLGAIVSDAIVVPEPFTALVERIRAAADEDVRLGPLDPADARARLEDAVRTASLMFPPVEGDSWPEARPLVQWVLRLLPEGGRTWERPEWSNEDLAALQERFLASTCRAGNDDPDHRTLLESLVWFGTDYGPGDPMRWSPASVEILLADWIPRKIVADVPYLDKAPDLLRAWIRFCHAERGIRTELTDRTLEMVDELEPDYRSTIRSPRPQGPEALLAAMGLPVGDDEDRG